MPAEPPALEPDVAFSVAGRTLLQRHLTLLLDSLPGVTRGEAEAVHDLRVATRKLRAALAVFAKLLDPDAMREAERQVARLAQGFSAVRDLDVQIDALRKACQEVSRDEQVGIQRAVRHLVRRRTRERKLLKKTLDELEKGKLEKRLRRLLGEVS